MNLEFFLVLLDIGLLILIAIPGFIFRKINILKSEDSRPLVVFLLYITQPFLIIMSFQGKTYSPDILGSLGITFLFASIIMIIMIFLSGAVFAKTKLDKRQKGVYIFASAFPNCGYLGLPLLSMLFSQSEYLPDMLIYASIFITAYNIINWTVGIYIISGDKKYISLKNAFLNPASLALMIALPLFFLKININDISPKVADVFNMIGQMTTPLSMTIFGIKLAEMPLKKIFASVHVFMASFLKLIAMPLIMFGLLLFFKDIIETPVIYVLILISAMPTAANTVANADRFNGDSLTAAKCMLLSTLLLIITLPVITLLLY